VVLNVVLFIDLKIKNKTKTVALRVAKKKKERKKEKTRHSGQVWRYTPIISEFRRLGGS
jgi:hypothetical protein